MNARIAVALAAGLMSTAASAVNLAQDGIGEVAVAPYYTVRDGWLTTFNLTNTGPDPIAVKVRFKEHRNGRDVLNFTVALAGHDVFAGVVREARDGSGPVLTTSDQVDYDGRRTCTVPSSLAEPGAETSFSTRGFGPPGTENDDGGPSGDDAAAIDRLREGHIEFIVMGHTRSTDGSERPATEIGDAILRSDCAELERAFSTATATNGLPSILNTARQFGEPINVLKLAYGLLNPARGIEIDGVTTVWANFYNEHEGPRPPVIEPEDNADCSRERTHLSEEGQYDWYPEGASGSCRNLISTQTEVAGLEPSLNDAFPAIASWWSDAGAYPSLSQPTAVTIVPAGETDGPTIPAPPVSFWAVPRGVDALSLTIQRAYVLNEWSTNDALGVSTEWVVTLPTKPFYTDGGTGLGNLGPGDYSALNDRRNRVYIEERDLPYLPFERSYGQPVDGDRMSAGACQNFSYDAHEQYDRVGRRESGLIILLPPLYRFCDSANVLISGDRIVLGALRPQGEVNGVLPLYQSIGSAGWTQMRLGLGAIQAMEVGPYFNGTVENHRGLPVIGFAVKQRSFGSVTRNYASSIPHSYVREAVAAE